MVELRAEVRTCEPDAVRAMRGQFRAAGGGLNARHTRYRCPSDLGLERDTPVAGWEKYGLKGVTCVPAFYTGAETESAYRGAARSTFILGMLGPAVAGTRAQGVHCVLTFSVRTLHR